MADELSNRAIDTAGWQGLKDFQVMPDPLTVVIATSSFNLAMRKLSVKYYIKNAALTQHMCCNAGSVLGQIQS